MQIVVIIVFASLMGLSQPGGPRIGHAPWPLLAALAVGHVLVTAALTAMATRKGLKQLYEGRGYSAAVKGFRRSGGLVNMWLAASMALLALLGAADAMRGFKLLGLPMAAELLLMALFLAALIVHWRLSYPFERACRAQVEQDLMLAGMPVRRGWTAGEHLEFSIRHQFLFVAVPLGLIMLLHELISRVTNVWDLPHWQSGALRVAAVAGVFFLSPVLLVGVWKTRELANGELRQRLQRLCERIGLSYRRILIWDTGGVLANAAVMGLHRSVRYILISDALLEQLTDEQVTSVFGHEAGHIRHRHMFLFVLFIVASSLICGTAGSFAGIFVEHISASADMAVLAEELVMTASLGLMFWLGFGRLSRALERQADVFGSVCAGMDAEDMGRSLQQSDMLPGTADSALRFGFGSRVFISALEGIARINGMPREGRNWRHGSIADRVNFLWRWRSCAYDGDSFDKSIRSVWFSLWLLLAVGLLGLYLTWSRWI